MYLTFHGRRITSDFHFVHAPPPRHTLLAWPATEVFDALPKLAHESIRTEAVNGSISQGASGLLGSGPLSPKIVICTMFRNEGLYLEEWLKYHLLLGVSKVSAFLKPGTKSANGGMVLAAIPAIFCVTCIHRTIAEKAAGCYRNF